MQFTHLTAFLSLVAAASLTSAKSCNADECVSYFHGGDCQSGGYISDYVPTCGGNCFQYSSFDSILVEGNGILGTDCHAYSDSNCENELVDSGNVVTSVCVNSQGANSMRCFYNC
ncbi:hypothetical protein MVEN_00284100 [Mycena venus]|uniref:Uncharacterized protein n=1 Tax=Mycena venus TaxID=2733690 RepID=A0A8H6Z2C0_9AGAR|nr:hypothetical protein MVEN_00284100 [Mycena venus]